MNQKLGHGSIELYTGCSSEKVEQCAHPAIQGDGGSYRFHGGKGDVTSAYGDSLYICGIYRVVNLVSEFMRSLGYWAT